MRPVPFMLTVLAVCSPAVLAAPRTPTTTTSASSVITSTSNDTEAYPDNTGFTTVFFDEPTKDASTYANLGSAGNTRTYAWLSTYPGEGRQSNLLTMWNTASAGIPTGSDAARVVVRSATFTACTYISGPRAIYDPDADPWQTYLWAGGDINVFNEPGGVVVVGTVAVDADPRFINPGPAELGNAPLELFGVRFNNDWSAASWNETSAGTPAFQNGVYNAEPIDFDAAGNERSVLYSLGESAVEFVNGPFVGNNGQTYITDYPTGDFLPSPQDGFDPNPFGIGESRDVAAGTPGNQFGQAAISLGDDIPYGHRFFFDLDVRSPSFQAYMRAGFAEGWVSFIASQLAEADRAGGDYSYFFTREGADDLPSSIDIDPSTLSITYTLLPVGDLDANMVVDARDVRWAIIAAGEPKAYQGAFPHLAADALADVNQDGRVDYRDILAVAARASD